MARKTLQLIRRHVSRFFVAWSIDRRSRIGARDRWDRIHTWGGSGVTQRFVPTAVYIIYVIICISNALLENVAARSMRRDRFSRTEAIGFDPIRPASGVQYIETH